jgi:hypothetical protein
MMLSVLFLVEYICHSKFQCVFSRPFSFLVSAFFFVLNFFPSSKIQRKSENKKTFEREKGVSKREEEMEEKKETKKWRVEGIPFLYKSKYKQIFAFLLCLRNKIEKKLIPPRPILFIIFNSAFERRQKLFSSCNSFHNFVGEFFPSQNSFPFEKFKTKKLNKKNEKREKERFIALVGTLTVNWFVSNFFYSKNSTH